MMALILKRNRWSKLAGLILLLLFLQLMTYVRKEVLNGNEKNILEVLPNAPSNDYGVPSIYLTQNGMTANDSDYKFISTYFSNASDGSWQNVGDTIDVKNKLFAFSAFLDNRLKNQFIAVIAVAKTKKNFRKKVWCKFWYRNVNYFNTFTVSGNYKLLSEHWNLLYSGYYIQCPIDNNMPVPDAISLVTDPAEIPSNIFKVIVNFEKPAEWSLSNVTSTFTNMAVCVKPLHYEYNEVMEFLQFVELHRIMGVSQFYLYNHTVGPEVNCLLNNYIKEKIVTVLPWKLPVVTQKEIRTEGIFAALNDCLYRTMHLYSHATFIDFDEYIVLKNNDTYKEFFNYLNVKPENKNKVAFIFKNAFFYRQWPDEEEVKNFNDPVAENLLILRKTRRKTALHNYRTRSKYIVRPALINMVGNHFIWEYADKAFKPFNVDPNDGILHHYRTCEFGGDDCVNQKSVVDKTAYKYKDQLIRAVKSQIDKYGTECQLDKFIH